MLKFHVGIGILLLPAVNGPARSSNVGLISAPGDGSSVERLDEGGSDGR